MGKHPYWDRHKDYSGGDPVESSNERLRNDSPLCREMTKIMRIMRGEAGELLVMMRKRVHCATPGKF